MYGCVCVCGTVCVWRVWCMCIYRLQCPVRSAYEKTQLRRLLEYCPQSIRADFAKAHGTKITLESQSFMCSRLLVTGTALPPDLLPRGFLYSRRQRHSFSKGFLCHSGRVAEVTQGKQGKPSVCPSLDRRVSWSWSASGCFEL